MKRLLRFPLVLQLALAILIGCFLGFGADRFWPRTFNETIGEFGTLIIRFLKMLATPLIFFAIVDAFCHTSIPAKRGLRLLGLSFMNACMAALIALTLSNLIPVKKFVSLESLSQSVVTSQNPPLAPPVFSFSAILQGLVPQNILEPFTSNNVLSVVLLALFVGAAIRKIKTSQKMVRELEVFQSVVSFIFKALIEILGWVVKLLPLAVIAILAKVTAQNMVSLIVALGFFTLIVMLGLFIHVVIYYSLLIQLFTKTSPLKFFKNGSEALMTAFSTGSSLATLPVTLRTLQEKMGVSLESSRLAACVGTNLNHDGILLYEAVAALFVAQIYGIDLSLSQQLQVGLMSTLAAVGIAGVPEAGFITLSLVVGSVGLPLTALPLLLPVDWFLGRLRATTNVASDMTVAHLLEG